MSQPLGPLTRSFYHAWVPHTAETHDQFVKDILHAILDAPNEAYVPSVEEFKRAVEANGQVELFNQAILQVQQYYRKWGDPSLFVKDFNNFLDLLNKIVRSAPRLYRANVNGVTIGEPVGVPLYLLLDLISNTSAAFTLLTTDSFNRALQKVLDDWGTYLRQPESSYTLANEWFSPEGLAILESPLGGLSFDATFKVDIPKDEKNGQRYVSWDSFFVREFLEPNERPAPYTGIPLRPIPKSPNPDVFFIHSPCESTIFRTAYHIQRHDTFWLKTQNYSLYDILGGDLPGSFASYAEQLKGATAVQAFLSPADYHCWHLPIAGGVISKVFDGTYYAVLPDEGAPPYDPDLEPGDPHGAMIRSQPWLSVAATRAVFIIKPDESSPIKLAALIEIGMVEVSTCEITYPGNSPTDFVPLKLGEELGKFHFGGSTYTLIVKPKEGHKVVWQDIYNAPIRPGQARWVNSVIGQVWKDVPGVKPEPDTC